MQYAGEILADTVVGDGKDTAMGQYRRDHRFDLVTGLTRLSLWYAARQARLQGGFALVLARRTPVYRFTCLWDGISHPAQPDFPWESSRFGEICRHLQSLRQGRTCPAWEEAGLEVLLPLLQARLDRDIEAWPWIPCGYVPDPLPAAQVSGLFACESSEGSDRLAIHIANSCMPRSPFGDMAARARELLALLQRARRRQPRLQSVGCNSWLNSFPPFLTLFPPAWAQDRVAPVDYSFSWWGQMVARDGRFHARNAEHLRGTGSFPFQARDGHCEIEALVAHLRRLLAGGPGMGAGMVCHRQRGAHWASGCSL